MKHPASTLRAFSRTVPINGLTSGAKYLFEIRSTSHSDWSDGRDHRSM